MLVRAITHHPFRLGSPNLDQRCKRPWLRSLLFCGTIDRDIQGQIELQSRNLPHFELVHAITHHQFKLQFPNLEQKCILALFRPLPILGLIEIELHFNSIFNFKPRPNLAFYIHHWHSLVRPAGLKVGRIERIRRECEPIQRTAIGTAPWHRLFHSVNVSWWDHIECATGRRPLGLGVVMGLGL